jgi:hypothetical protein
MMLELDFEPSYLRMSPTGVVAIVGFVAKDVRLWSLVD